MPCVYLLSIEPPLPGGRAHYIGFSKQPTPHARLARHLAGRGAQFTKRAMKSGRKISLVMFWSGPGADEAFESFLKDGMNTWDWCPHCGRNKLPVPKLTDYSPEEARMRASSRKQRQGRKFTSEEVVDKMISSTYGAHLCL